MPTLQFQRVVRKARPVAVSELDTLRDLQPGLPGSSLGI
jgi:hypothetical protein